MHLKYIAECLLYQKGWMHACSFNFNLRLKPQNATSQESRHLNNINHLLVPINENKLEKKNNNKQEWVQTKSSLTFQSEI